MFGIQFNIFAVMKFLESIYCRIVEPQCRNGCAKEGILKCALGAGGKRTQALKNVCSIFTRCTLHATCKIHYKIIQSHHQPYR